MRLRFGSNRTKNEEGTAGKGCATIFFFIFFAVGLAFTYFIALSFFNTIETYSWNEIDCVVVSSSVSLDGPDENPYQFHVRYRYEVNGRRYESDRLQLSTYYDGSYEPMQRRMLQYAPGSAVKCLVDPDNPSEAILERDSLLIGLLIFFPLIFVAIGGGGIYFTWFYRESPKRKEPISARAKSGKVPRAVAYFFALLITGGGAAILFKLILPQFTAYLASQSWPATECTVIASDVRSHKGDDSTTYSIDILYEFVIDDVAYRSNRYEFMEGSSSGYSSKQDVVRTHPKGKVFTCYVDPEDPVRAVIDRSFNPIFFIVILPIAMLLGGLFWLWYLLRPKTFSEGAAEARFQEVVGERSESFSPDGRLVFRGGRKRITGLVAVILFSLFWNGIVSVFVVQAVKSWQRGSPEWFLTIFLIPFVLIGLLTILGIFHTFLALFNPSPTLALSGEVLRLGSQMGLTWSWSGRVSSVTKFTITLVGEERATYRRGTSTVTDTEVFYSSELVSTTFPQQIEAGTCTLAIPEDTMHSFSAPNNKIAWKIEVQGEIARWPDVSESFEIFVRT